MNEDELLGLDNTMKFVRNFVNVVTCTDKIKPLLKIQNNPIFAEGAKTKGDLDNNNSAYLMQFMPDGTAGFDEHLLTIMALVSHNWLATQGSGTVFNNDDAINAILGRASSAEVLSDERAALAEAGVVQNSLAEILGREIFTRLGLDIKDNIGGNFESNVEIGLGELAIYAMLESGHMTQKAINVGALKEDIMAEQVFTTEFGNELEANFIRVAIYEDEQVLEPAEVIIEIAKDATSAKDVLEVIYETPIKIVEPQFEPVTSVPSKQKRTNQNVPEDTKKTIKKMQATPHGFKENMVMLTDFLGLDILYEIEGYNVDIEGTTNITQHASVKGKNLGIVREFKLGMEFIEANKNDLNKPFYFEQQINKNNRIQPASNTVNPVTSKIHRHMFGLKDHYVTV